MSNPDDQSGSLQDVRDQRRREIEQAYDTAVGLFMSEIARLCGYEFKTAPVSVFIALTREYRNSIITCALDNLEDKENG